MVRCFSADVGYYISLNGTKHCNGMNGVRCDWSDPRTKLARMFPWGLVFVVIHLLRQVVSDFEEMKKLIARLHVAEEEDDDEDGEDFMER